jgi:hypothetical protein
MTGVACSPSRPFSRIDRLIVFLFQIDDAVPAEPGGWKPVFASSATIW